MGAGLIFVAFSLLGYAVEFYELDVRCHVGVGCNPSLVSSISLGLILLGLLLAFGAFLVGLSLAASRKGRTRMLSAEFSLHFLKS